MSYISTDSIERLRFIRQQAPTVALGYLFDGKDLKETIRIMRDLHCEALVVPVSAVNKTLIHKAHQRSLHVCVYTVNNKKSWEELAAQRVDAMFTDYPDLLGMPEYEQPTLGLTNED